MNRQQILEMIQINERMRLVAKQRNEYDVVAYHQRTIDKLYRQLKATNQSLINDEWSVCGYVKK